MFFSMERVEANGEWSLFCPSEAPGLVDVYGDEFNALYEKYEKEGRARKTIPAQKLWYAIIEAQIETGGPFMVYKDHANRMFVSSSLLQMMLTLPQASLTRRTWALSSPPTYAPRSSNTLPLTRLLSAILPPSLFPHLSKMVYTTSRSFMMSARL